MLRDSIFRIITQNQDLVEVAGSDFLYRVRIFVNGKKPMFLSSYAVEFLIARYDAQYSVVAADGVYDPVQQNFTVIFPSVKTWNLFGNYTYQIKITTPNKQEIVKNYGHLHVIKEVSQ